MANAASQCAIVEFFGFPEGWDTAALQPEIGERVLGVINEQMNSKATLDSNVVTDLNADSVDLAELIMSIEDEFEIDFGLGYDDLLLEGTIWRFALIVQTRSQYPLESSPV